MRLKVLQESLSKALNVTSRFASSKAQLPVLANILLRTKKNKLIISATNLETSIAISIGAKIEKEGDITVPSRTITDLISNLNLGQISLETEKEQLKIKTQEFKSSLSGMNSSDFPTIPTSVGKSVLGIPVNNLLNGLSKVLFAVSTDETRPVLTGVLVMIKVDTLVLVSTDGFRLSQKKIKLEQKTGILEDKNVILPKNVLSELSRLDNEKNLIDFSYQEADNQVVFRVSDSILSSRIIEGEFPDFEKIIPKDSKIVINLDKEEFLRAVRLASVFARDSANVVKIAIKKDLVSVSAESHVSGNQETKLDTQIKENVSGASSNFVIAFNYRFLEDFLNSCEGDSVRVEVSEPNSPAIFLDSKDSDYLHIIMPVKI